MWTTKMAILSVSVMQVAVALEVMATQDSRMFLLLIGIQAEQKLHNGVGDDRNLWVKSTTCRRASKWNNETYDSTLRGDDTHKQNTTTRAAASMDRWPPMSQAVTTETGKVENERHCR